MFGKPMQPGPWWQIEIIPLGTNHYTSSGKLSLWSDNLWSCKVVSRLWVSVSPGFKLNIYTIPFVTDIVRVPDQRVCSVHLTMLLWIAHKKAYSWYFIPFNAVPSISEWKLFSFVQHMKCLISSQMHELSFTAYHSHCQQQMCLESEFEIYFRKYEMYSYFAWSFNANFVHVFEIISH